VCYYLRRARPRDGDFDGEVERDPAVNGKFWGVGSMEYSVHPKFLRSIQAAVAQSPGPSRAAMVEMECRQLRCKTRREVMDWLTSLVAGSQRSSSLLCSIPFLGADVTGEWF
jgi:hypothetical protein